MNDSRDGAGVAMMVAVIVVILLIACGAAAFILLRQQTLLQRQAELVQREQMAGQAAAQAARFQAEAQRRSTEAGDMNAAALDATPEDVANAKTAEAAIRNVLLTQQSAWNDGDIGQFMEFYWNSDELTFSSGGKVTRTWQGTLENYKQRYPSRQEMGELAFQNLEITMLGPQAAFVLGDWKLSRKSGMLGGNFTLVFRRLDGKWLIVHDHTSRTADP